MKIKWIGYLSRASRIFLVGLELMVFLIFPFGGIATPAQDVKPNYSEENLKNVKQLIKEKKWQKAEKMLDTLLSGKKDFFEAHQLKAELYLRQKQMEKALDYLTGVIEAYPDRSEPLQIRGEILLNNLFFLSAWDDLFAAFKKGASNTTLFENLSLIAQEREDFSNALLFLKKALKINPNDDTSWHKIALISLRMGEYDQAETAIKKAIKLNPHHFLYYKILLELTKKSDDTEEIKSQLITMMKLFPNEAYGYLKYSTLLLRMGKLDEATVVLEETIKKIQNEPELYYQLGMILFILQKDEKALQVLLQGLKLAPKSDWAKIQIAKLYFRLRQADKAIQYLKMAKEEKSGDIYVYYQLAKYYNSIDDTYSAEEVILDGLNIDPDNIGLIAEYAFLLEKRGKLEEAVLAYQVALQRMPDNYFFHGKLGRLFWLLGNTNMAVKHLQESISLGQDATWVRVIYIEVLLSTKEWSNALAEIKTLLEIEPNNFWAYAQKAIVEQQLGKLPQALASINKAIIIHPQQAWLKEIEAFILEEMDQFDMAEISLEEALKLNPAHGPFWVHLALVQTRQGKSVAASNSMDKAIAIDNLDLWGIELNQYISGKSATTWGFSKESLAWRIYEKIVFRKFQEATKILEDKENKTITNEKYLLYFLQVAKGEKDKITSNFFADIDLNDRSLSGWNCFYLGTYFLNSEKYTMAETAFEKALKLGENNDGLQIQLAFTYEKLEKFAKAISILEAFIRSHPDSKWVKLRLALLFDIAKKPANAERIYLDILGTQPDNDIALNNLAWMYLTTDDKNFKKLNLALKLSLKAVKINPSPANFDTLAEAFFQNKEYDKSIKTIEKAMDLDRKNLDYFKKQKKKFQRAKQNK